jgi:hypothetical protein
MHQTDYVSHHSFSTVIKNDVRVWRFITITLNPEKIANSNVKCRSLCKNEIKSLANTSVHWVIASRIVGTTSSRRNLNSLSWNKAIRSISLDVDLMGLIILKLGPECFSGIY